MPIIGNPIYQSAFVVDQFSGNGSTVAFTMSVAPAGVTNVLVAVSGVLQDPSTYGVVGNTITFSAAPPTGTGNISCRYLGVPVTGVTTTAYRTVTEFTATAGQTTFTPPSYNVGFINVYLNGVLLGSADYTASNGTTVVLATGASAGNLVTVESFQISSVLNAIPNTAGAVTSLNIANDVTINFADGSASTPSITNTGDTNTGIFFPAADTIAFSEGGVESMRIDSVGRVGIGTNSPAQKFVVSESGTNFVTSVGGGVQFVGTTTNNAMAFITNSNEYMRIDTAGRVTTPSQPFFYAERSGNQTGYDASSQGDVVVIYNSVITNTGNYYNSANGKFTAPVAGVYAFFAGAYSSVNNFGQMWLVVNGSRANGTDWNYGSGSVNFQVGHWIIKLNANDTVGFHPYNGSVTSGQIDANSSHTYFRGTLLG